MHKAALSKKSIVSNISFQKRSDDDARRMPLRLAGESVLCKPRERVTEHGHADLLAEVGGRDGIHRGRGRAVVGRTTDGEREEKLGR